jgi:hypothetical protein
MMNDEDYNEEFNYSVICSRQQVRGRAADHLGVASVWGILIYFDDEHLVDLLRILDAVYRSGQLE